MNAKQVQYKKTGKLAVKIDIGLNRKLVPVLQNIPSKYHPKGKYWTCLLTHRNVGILHKHKIKLCPKLEKYYHGKAKKVKLSKVKIKGLKGTLRKYQSEGVSFIEQIGGKGLIADEMGLGKTIQAIAYLQHHPELRPALIVVPGCVKYKWEREVVKWMDKPGDIQILSGQTPNEKISGDIVIANYDILHYWRMKLYKAGFKILIVDEVQYIKSNTAKRTNVVKRIGRKTKHLIGLSGTPIENRPMELFNMLNLCKPKLFKEQFSFGMQFCGGFHDGYRWNFNGASNIVELNKLLLENVMIRRLKKDVLRELPDIQYNVVPLSLSNQKDYDSAKDDFINYVKETKGMRSADSAERAQTLAQLTALKLLVAQGKIKETIEWVDDFLESGNKLVLACWHKEVVQTIHKHYGKIAIKIDGSTKNKDVVAEEFQHNDKLKLAVVNMKAGGVGIDLFAAADVAIMEYPWSPTTIDQMIARVHRMGQKAKKVTAHYLVGLGTIDDYLVSILDKKQNIISQVMDGKDAKDVVLIQAVIDNLLNEK